MRILHIHPSLKCGGIEAMVCGLANEMSKSCDVTVCSIFEASDKHQFWNSLDNKIKKVSLHKKKPGFSVKELFKIYKLISNGNFDIVHVHGFIMYYVLSVFFFHKKVKFFYTIHSDARKEGNAWDRRFIRLKKFFFKEKWITPVTISEASQESFHDLYKCDSLLINNGIQSPTLSGIHRKDIDKYRITPNTKVFLHAGRIDTPKNQEVLCQSFKDVIAKDYDVVLLIAGPVAEQGIFDKIKKYLCDRIVYIGEISNLREWFAHADAMPMPSIWEGLPVVLLEAMSVGCVPICSPVGGIPNVITDGQDGIISKSPSFSDFSEALCNFLSMDSEKTRQMSENAKETFTKSYTIKAVAEQYIEAYSKGF